MDVENSSIKHSPSKVNNCVKRRQENAKKNSKQSVFQFYLQKSSQTNVLFKGGRLY